MLLTISGIGSFPASAALPAKIDIITLVFLFILFKIFEVCLAVYTAVTLIFILSLLSFFIVGSTPSYNLGIIDQFEELNNLSGQALHAKTLKLIHPSTKKLMSFTSDLPDNFKKILNLLENLSS